MNREQIRADLGPLTVTNVPRSLPENARIYWMTTNLKKFCVLPWLNLNTNPNGNIKLCCSIQRDHFVADDRPFNLGLDDIDDIWHSKYMMNARLGHRTNVGAGECAECYNMEAISSHSPRIGQNEVWVNNGKHDPFISKCLTDVTDSTILHNPKQLPISLELRLGNQCNLKCMSCWGMSSSLIHTERTRYLKDESVDTTDIEWIKPQWEIERQIVENTDVTEWFETDMFYSNFRKMAPTLKRLYTTGGEPTIIKANYRMLQMLIDAGNTDCRIEFTSNMVAWNPLFYDKLSKFRNVEIQMSVDGAGEIGEYIRYPSDMKKVTENMLKAAALAAVNPGWVLKCYTVLQALNYAHIPAIWELLRQVADTHSTQIHWWPITLVAPPHLSLQAVPLSERQTAAEDIKQQCTQYKHSETSSFSVNQPTVDSLVDSIIKSIYDPVLADRLKTYTTFTDKQRARK